MELRELVEAFRGPLTGLLASWGSPWYDAEELAQESLADAWLLRERCRADLTDQEEFGKWLRGIARNRYRNWARARRNRARILPLGDRDVADPKAGGDSSASHDALRRAIQRLPKKLRQVVVMHYLDEASLEAVAGLLGLSKRAVEGRLYRARRELKSHLSAEAPTRPKGGRVCL
ncbi:MAG: sigma-70 family RNA polymerase sigma factor [Planctomycetota bacterium]